LHWPSFGKSEDAVFNSEDTRIRRGNAEREDGMWEQGSGLGITSYRSPGGDVVVRLAGALDSASAARMIEEMAAVDPRVGDRVVLHLADVTSLESSGVGALFYLDAFVRTRRGRLVISMPSREAEGTIARLGLEHHFSFVEAPGGYDGRSALNRASAGPS